MISGNLGQGITIRSTGGNIIQGNRIGTNAAGTAALANGLGVELLDGGSDTIGGNTAAARNIISGNRGRGISVEGGSLGGPETVQGNYIGTNAAGTAAMGNGQDGILLVTSNNTIGGIAPGQGNVISANAGNGINLAAGSGNTIQGNLIGTNASGTAALGNSVAGISVDGPDGNTIGGAAGGARNVISGNNDFGITFNGGANNMVQGNLIGTDAGGSTTTGSDGRPLGNTGVGIEVANVASGSNNRVIGNIVGGTLQGSGGGHGIATNGNSLTIQGNFVGTNAAGANLGNAGDGIQVFSGSNNTIGGAAAGQGNTIAFNGRNPGIGDHGNGVTVTHTSTGDAIRGNSIHDNAGLGIDLGNDGVTPNTPGGPHTGPNDLQNAPVLTGVTVGGAQTTITGTLNGIANTSFHLDFFAGTACDPSGHGEGQTYLGSSDVTTVGNDVSFSVTVNRSAAPGAEFTATATDPNGNTSEFSACFPPPAPATSTRTSTATSTATETLTATHTSTPTATATKPATSTDTATRTATPTPSGTATRTATATATSTAATGGPPGGCSVYALLSGIAGAVNITAFSQAPAIDRSITYTGPAGELTVRRAQVLACTAPNTPAAGAVLVGTASSPSTATFALGDRVQVTARMQNGMGTPEVDILDLSTGKITAVRPRGGATVRITSP